MKKEFALSLMEKAREAATNFSRSDRAFNANNETFEVQRIVPLSESTAAVFFNKNSGKRAVAFFYYLRSGGWRYLFPSDSHILGMESFGKHKLEVEDSNFANNFTDGEEFL